MGANLLVTLMVGVLCGAGSAWRHHHHHFDDGTRSRAAEVPVAGTEAFLDSIGVGVHLGAVKSNYGDVDAVIGALSYLGVHHVRDSAGGMLSGVLINGRWEPDPTFKLQRLADIGVLFDVVVGADFAASEDELRKHADYIEALEGPNEPEFNPVTYSGLSNFPAAVAVQRALFNFVKRDPVLRQKPVLHFAFAHAENTKTIGDLSDAVDFANVHSYPPHGSAPHTKMPADLASIASAPGKPVIVTETGYPTNDPSGPPGARLGKGHNFVDEDVQAKYLLDATLDNFKANVVRTDLYELFDERSDPQNTDEQAHFGLFRVDGSKKPSAEALHNLRAILQSGAGPSEPPPGAAPSWSVQQSLTDPAMDVATYNLLLRKSGGSFDLILWAEPPLWAAQLRRAPAPTPNDVVVRLDRPYRRIDVYDPLRGIAPQSTYGDASSAPVTVTDHPMVIEFSDR